MEQLGGGTLSLWWNIHPSHLFLLQSSHNETIWKYTYGDGMLNIIAGVQHKICALLLICMWYDASPFTVYVV